MVIPVGEQTAARGQELLLVEKAGGKIKRTSIAPVIFVPLVHER
jgi:protein-L-isoaspartate O-methyltransferase